MRNPEAIYQFSNGKLSPVAKLPEWIADAIVAEREHQDRLMALSDQGAEQVESYGRMNETVDVWRFEGRQWLVDYWDIDSHIMAVYLSTIPDFAAFQASWVAPMAVKIMAADTYLRETIEAGNSDEEMATRLH
jgi:hypothetical protein